MSDLEKSAERFIKVCQLMSEGAENVRGQLENVLADFRAGRAELDGALAELNERRARFIKESSETAAGETSQAMDSLAERMERLLAGGPFESGGGKAEPATQRRVVPLDDSEPAAPHGVNA